jgi:uncharacterized protein
MPRSGLIPTGRRLRAGAPFLIFALLVVATAACGRKGAPVAPEVRVPIPPSALGATVVPHAVVVEWTNPGRRLDGSRLRDLAVVRVYRHDDSGIGDPRAAIRDRDRIVGYTTLAVIDLGRPEQAAIQGDRVRYVDRAGLVAGRRYTYVVTATDALGRISAPSPRLPVTFITAPSAPATPSAEAGETEARLAWAPPGTLIDGSPLVGAVTYDLLRAASPDVPPSAIATALSTVEYSDTALENERTYYYAVRAVRTDAGGVAQSEPSPTVAVTPRDMTPPTPPTGLVAIPSVASVRLAWNPSPEPDVAGYVIYRTDARGERVRVGRTTTPGTVFTDREVPAGAYRYTVTAVDGASRANESAPTETVSVTVP